MSEVARRMALSRERRKRGLLCVPIEVRLLEREELAVMGLLTAEQLHDVTAVRKAIHNLFDQVFRRR